MKTLINTDVSHRVCLLTIALSILNSPALAQSDNRTPVNVGEGELFVSADLRYEIDDNKNNSANNPIETTGFILAPEVLYQANKGTFSLETSYNGRYGSFDESAYDFDDHRFALAASSGLTSRLSISGDLNFSLSHDDFEDFIDVDALVDQNITQYRSTSARAGVRYGARGAIGNVAASLQVFNYALPEFDVSVLDTSPEYQLVEPSVEFSLRVSPDTRAVFQLSHGLFSFDTDSLNRSITSALLGFSFAPTGKLRGDIRVGAALSSFDDNDIDDQTDAILRASGTYQVRTFSTINFSAQRSLDNRNDSAVDFSEAGTSSDTGSITWRHSWSSRFSTQLAGSVIVANRECPNPTTRYTSARFSFTYSLTRRVSLGAGVNQRSRAADTCADDDADGENLEYDRQIIDVLVRFAL